MPINIELVEHEKPIFRSSKLKHSYFATICLAIIAMDGEALSLDDRALPAYHAGLKKQKRVQRRREFH